MEIEEISENINSDNFSPQNNIQQIKSSSQVQPLNNFNSFFLNFEDKFNPSSPLALADL